MIEVIEFYPIKEKKTKINVIGTLRVQFTESGIQILGIAVIKNNKHLFFCLPAMYALHQETGKEIRFPCISFEDPAKQRELISEIRTKGIAFIEKWRPENSPVLPIKTESKKSEPQIVESVKSLPALKKPTMKLYVDPPPMKNKNKKR